MSGFQLADVFESVADAVPERTAFVCAGERLSYAELDERATRLAHALAAQGIGPGDHFGTCLHNGVAYVTTLLACLKIRAVSINVNYRYVEEELRYLFTNADLVGVVFDRELGPRIAAVRGGCPLLRSSIYVEDGSGADVAGLDAVEFAAAVAAGSPERDFPARSPNDVFVIYTGGTTGLPKGVMWRHEDLFFAALGGGNPMGLPVSSREELVARVEGSEPQRVSLPLAPLIHGAAQLATLITWNGGGKLVMQKRFDPDDAVRRIAEEGVNTISLVGDAMAAPLADALERNAAKGRHDVSSLIVVSSAGAIFSTGVKARLKRLFPNLVLVDSYGSTETGFQGTGTGAESRSFGEGLSFQMNERTVVIGEDRRPLAPGSGVPGRVALKGHVPLGYYKDPERSAEAFFERGGERYVITGDLAQVEPDGTVRLFGRGSLCINTGGEKVFIEEVENALKSHAAVQDAVVVGVDDPAWGERVTALVTLRPGAGDPGEAGLRAHARRHVAGYKVPKQIFRVEEIFRGPNGKADYRLARRIATERAEARKAERG